MKGKFSNWLQDVYHIGMLVSLVFIMAQVYYARSTMLQTSEWEKAKMTIENIERFKEALIISPLSDNGLWLLGDGIWTDASTSKGWEQTDTLRVIYFSLFDNVVDRNDENIRMIEVMDDFAYPIVMGYASETGSFQSVMRQFSTYGNFIMPFAFHGTPLIGLHAKLLYRLWRIKMEIVAVENAIDGSFNWLMERKDRMFCYEETDFTKASLKAYRKKLDKKLKEAQKEIEVFRKNSLK